MIIFSALHSAFTNFEALSSSSVSSPAPETVSTEAYNIDHITLQMADTEREDVVSDKNQSIAEFSEIPDHNPTPHHHLDLSTTRHVPNNNTVTTATKLDTPTLVAPKDKTSIGPQVPSERHINHANITNVNTNASDVELGSLPNSTVTTRCYYSPSSSSAANTFQRQRTRRILHYVMLALAGMVVIVVVACAIVYVVASPKFSRAS
ncbi:hypothetical protein GT037_006117 [Alternaria burnsii]|uniref:Uncharacterized protein n=1 Tax=Alternaria burnsii TaxID=1187904 RepID=A0A8H7B9U3_9PLEO|nr:uncharacterized protein GT037_006117 [Alternaria burnsii]KAF7675398.1 hypothetical protein GT037_006117 [Alternaria burnsii]